MIPALTTMAAAPAAVLMPGTTDAAMPGFAALLASAGQVVTEQPAPVPAPVATTPIMASTLAVGVAAGTAASAQASVSVAQGPLPDPVMQTAGDAGVVMPGPAAFLKAPPEPVPPSKPGAPSRIASIPTAVAPPRLETSQLPMPRVSLAEHSVTAVAVQHLPLSSKPATDVSAPSLRFVGAVASAETQLSGASMAISAVEIMPRPETNFAVSRVVSSHDAKPVPKVERGRPTTGADDIASAAVALEALPTTPDTPCLAPSLSFAEVAVSAPMVPQAAALPEVSTPPLSALTRAEPVVVVPSALVRQPPDQAAPVLRARLPVSALSLPATAVAADVVTGIEPTGSSAAPSMPLAAMHTSQHEIMPTVALTHSSAPAVAAPDPASRSFVQANALSPAMALALPQPASTTSPAAITALPREAGAPLRAGNAFAAARLPRDVDDRDTVPGLLAIAEPSPMRTPLRAEATVAAASPLMASVETSSAPASDLAVESGRLGAVRIGIEGDAGDLKVSLGLSPAAAALVAAEAPRLIADLAAGGVRLQSLDVSGGGVSGGQQQPQPHHAPATPRTASPLVAVNPVTARPSTADRYA